MEQVILAALSKLSAANIISLIVTLAPWAVLVYFLSNVFEKFSLSLGKLTEAIVENTQVTKVMEKSLSDKQVRLCPLADVYFKPENNQSTYSGNFLHKDNHEET